MSSRELTLAVLERISACDPMLHAFITVDRWSALAAADAADRDLANGVSRGPLQGIPVSVKDCFFTAGMRTTAGSKIYEDWIPDQDSAVAERLREAGAVILGKANMFELATGWGTVGHFPLAVNPWNGAHSPGGSSSGSAAAVAAGMGPVSLGTDGGGSVRVPASYCGVTGFKPTYGIVSEFGTIPVGPSVSHVGVVARSVRDAAIAAWPLVGYDPRDPNAVFAKPTEYSSALTGNLEGVRVGVPWAYIEGHITQESRQAFMGALAVLRDAGAEVMECEIAGLDGVGPSWTTIVYAELAAFHEPHFRKAPDDFGPELRERIDSGLRTTAVEYFHALESRAFLRARYLAAMATIDLIATPTAPGPAPTLDELRARVSKLQEIGQLARYTRPYNLTGMPAITVPDGLTTDGLPLGFELAGRPHEDALVLQAADAYQRRTSWHLMRPPAFA